MVLQQILIKFLHYKTIIYISIMPQGCKFRLTVHMISTGQRRMVHKSWRSNTTKYRIQCIV